MNRFLAMILLATLIGAATDGRAADGLDAAAIS